MPEARQCPSSSYCRFLAICLLSLGLGSLLAACEFTPENPTSPPITAPAWWHDAVFYEVFVRSYADSDGDGNGDIQGLIQKLDYLNDGDPATTSDLGVTAVWLMPVMESASYHGYDAVDYYAVEADYGTTADFKAFIQAAHARGMHVIVDLMLNHTSSEHPWFVAARSDPQAPERGWYLWQPDNSQDTFAFGNPTWHPSETGYYYGLFWAGMPDLNYRNPAVTAEMEAVSRFWLEEMEVDGFRLDAIRHLIETEGNVNNTAETHRWLQGYKQTVAEVNDDALLIGEIWSNTEEIAPYIDNDEVDIAFEFNLAGAILDSVRHQSPIKFRNQLAEVLATYPPGQFATFLANHDLDRVLSQLEDDPAKARVAATILLTIPGVPFIYYGEEIGMQGQKPDEWIRTPMQWDRTEHAGFTSADPWQPVNGNYESTNVFSQTLDPGSMLNRYRRLIQLRQEHLALRRGGLVTLQSSCEQVFGFLRFYSDAGGKEPSAVLVLINFSEEEAESCNFSLAESGLPAGTYSLFNLLLPADSGRLVIEENGRLRDVVLQQTLPAQDGIILLIESGS